MGALLGHPPGPNDPEIPNHLLSVMACGLICLMLCASRMMKSDIDEMTKAVRKRYEACLMERGRECYIEDGWTKFMQ